MVLDKDGEDQLDGSCERWNIKKSRKKGTSYKTKQRNANWIGHILSTNCLLQHVVQWKTEETVRRGTWSRQLLDDLNETRRYRRLKEEALDRTAWGTRFGRGYGPVIRQLREEDCYVFPPVARYGSGVRCWHSWIVVRTWIMSQWLRDSGQFFQSSHTQHYSFKGFHDYSRSVDLLLRFYALW